MLATYARQMVGRPLDTSARLALAQVHPSLHPRTAQPEVIGELVKLVRDFGQAR